MSKFIVSLLSLCFLLSSCENMTEKELEDTISSGVFGTEPKLLRGGVVKWRIDLFFFI